MRILKIALATLFFMAVVIVSPALAQQKPAQDALMVMEVQVKPGMGLEWENYLRKDLLPAMKKAGMKDINTMRTGEFGVSDQYATWWTLKSLSELDTPGPFEKALGPEGWPVLLANTQRCIAGGRTYILTDQPEVRIAAKPGYVYKTAILVRQTVAPGRDAEFMRNAKELVAVFSKTNAKAVFLHRVGLGGNPNEYHWLVAVDTYADVEQFGQAFWKAVSEAKLTPMTGIVTHADMQTYAMVPELGIE
jgi:hypothetical protein